MKKLLAILFLALAVQVNAQYLWTNQVSSYWDNFNAWSPVFHEPVTPGIVYSWNLNSTYSAPISATLRTTMGGWQPDIVAVPFDSIAVGSNMTVIVNGVALVASNLSLTGNAALWLTGGGSYTNSGSFSWNPTSNGSIILNNGSMPNLGTLTIGGYNNSIAISNGSTFAQTGTLTVGNGGTSSNNSYLVGGLGASSLASNTSIHIGYLGGGYNNLVVTNATLVTSDYFFVGDSASNCSVTILAGATWLATLNTTNRYLYIGNKTTGGTVANSNHVTVNGGILNFLNYGAIRMGYGGSFNTMTLSNGATLLNTVFYIGNSPGDNNEVLNIGGSGLPTCFTNTSSLWLSQSDGSYSNVINVTNATLYVGNQINAAYGSGAYANQINIYSGGFVTTSNGLTIATYPGAATNVSGNIINLFGGVLTNGNPSYIARSYGGAKCVSNGLNVSNGGTLIGKSSLLIGYGTNDNWNFVTIGGVGVSSFCSNGGVINVGSVSSGYNSLTITNAQMVSNGQTLTLGGLSGNSLSILSGGTLTFIHPSIRSIQMGAGSINILVGTLANVQTITAGAGSQFNAVNTTLPASSYSLTAGASVTLSNATLINSNLFAMANSGTNSVAGSSVTISNSASFTASVTSGVNNWTNSTLTFVGNCTGASAAGANLDSVLVAVNSTNFLLRSAFSMNTLVNSGILNCAGLSISTTTATNLVSFIASNSTINASSFIQLGTFTAGKCTMRFTGGGTSSITNYWNLDFVADRTTLTNALITVAGNLTAEGRCRVDLQGGTLALANFNLPFSGYINNGSISNQPLTVFASDGVFGLVNSGARHR